MKIYRYTFILLTSFMFFGCQQNETNTTPKNQEEIIKENNTDDSFNKFINSDEVKLDKDLLEEINNLYTFHPKNLSEEEIDQKSQKLDIFWDKIKKDKNKLSGLRYALLNKKDNPFFLFDGSQLLLYLSEDKNDGLIAIDSISKTDLDNLQKRDYLKLVHHLGCEGYDVTKPIINALKDPNFKAIIPEHSLTLEHEESMIFLVFSQENTEKTFKELRKLLYESEDKTIIKTIITLLWAEDSKDNDLLIDKYLNGNVIDNDIKEYIKTITKNNKQNYENSENKLKAKRRQKICRNISDEVLIDFFKVTESIKY